MEAQVATAQQLSLDFRVALCLPALSPQGELFATAGLSASLFAETDRYRLFAKLVYPHLVRARAKLEKRYCADHGRVALEPVLLLGVNILQDLDGWCRGRAGSGWTRPDVRAGGAACNVKRWIRREAWRLRQAALALALAGRAVSPDATAGAATPLN